MRISHEAIYQSLYIEGRGALKRELVWCLRIGRALRAPRERSRRKAWAHVTPEVLLSERPAEVDLAIRELNSRYDTYAKRWGPINRITYRRTGRVDEVTGEDRLARIAPPQGRFKHDPHSPAVYALEDFDATTGTARKAPIMSGRVVAPRTPRLGADTSAGALAICLDTHGEVHIDEVARLLGRTTPAVGSRFGSLPARSRSTMAAPGRPP